MAASHGLIFAYLLDREGSGKKISWEEINQWRPKQGLIWLHFDYAIPEVYQWLMKESELEEVICDALLADEIRPRSLVVKNGLFVALRGINTNPGADPEDMTSVRVWIEEDRIITTCHRQVLPINDIAALIEKGQAPKNTGDFLVELTYRLVERMANVINNIIDQVDALEEEVVSMESHSSRPLIASVRRQIISLRRYLYPQKEAMAHLQNQRLSFLDESHYTYLRESSNQTTLYIEDLDSAKDRATVTQEELTSRLSEKLSSRMYILTLLTSIFLPLSFFTGLFSVNVNGIPGANSPWGFVIILVAVVILGVIQVWLLRRLRWF